MTMVFFEINQLHSLGYRQDHKRKDILRNIFKGSAELQHSVIITDTQRAYYSSVFIMQRCHSGEMENPEKLEGHFRIFSFEGKRVKHKDMLFFI